MGYSPIYSMNLIHPNIGGHLWKKKFNNLILFLISFIVSFIKLGIKTIFAIFKLKDAISDGSVWFAIFYQPFLVIIVVALFAEKIDSLLFNFLNGQGDIIATLLLVVGLIAIILLINSLIELIYRIRFKNGDYNTFFSIQKTAHNYMMAIISLIAIYAAIDSYNATTINTMLLAYGILIFICIIITDLYHALFLSQGIVEEIYNNFLNNYNRYKK